MTRSTIIPAIAFALAAACATAAAVDLPKQGAYSLTHTVVASAPAAIELGGGNWAAIIDARVIATNDSGSGFSAGCSGHCVGLDIATQLTVVCTWTDRDGDKFVTRGERAPGSLTVKGTIISGTGKYRGIEGHAEAVEEPRLADTAPGQRNIISHLKGEYRIP